MLRNLFKPIFPNWDAINTTRRQSSSPSVNNQVSSAAPENLKTDKKDPSLISFVNELSGWPEMNSDESRSLSSSFFANSSAHLKNLDNTQLKHLSVRDENKNNVNNPWCKNGMGCVSDNTGETSSSMETFSRSPCSSGSIENRSTDSKKSFMYMNFDKASSNSNTEVVTFQPEAPIFDVFSMKSPSAKHMQTIDKESKGRPATIKKNDSVKIGKVAKAPVFKSRHLHCRLQLTHTKERIEKLLQQKENKKQSVAPLIQPKPMELSSVFVRPAIHPALKPVFKDATTTIYFYNGIYTSTPPDIPEDQEFIFAADKTTHTYQ